MITLRKSIFTIISLLSFVSDETFAMNEEYVNQVIHNVTKFEDNKKILYTAWHKKDRGLIRWEFEEDKKTGTIDCKVCYTNKQGLDLGYQPLPKELFGYIVQKYDNQPMDQKETD